MLKRHYDADDYVSLRDPDTGAVLLNGIPFTADETFYVVGLMAYLNDPTVVDPFKGWTLYTHGQATAPVWLAPFLTALGVAWPAQTPAFEAKDLLFLSNEDCWIRFVGDSRVQHFIPKGDYMRFHRRCFMFFVQSNGVDGNLYAWLEG